jgi:hypothetical protein
MSTAQTTTDHDEIRAWVEERGGRPSRVKGRDEGTGGLLRIDFAEKDDNLEEIGWDEFFEAFEDNELAFLHQDKTSSGETSRFNKLISRKGE